MAVPYPSLRDVLFALLLAIAVSGCTPARVATPQPPAALLSASGTAQRLHARFDFLGALSRWIDEARVSELAKEQASLGKADADEIGMQLQATSEAFTAIGRERDDLSRQAAVLQQTLDAYDDDWLGPRAWRAIWWAAGIALATWLLLGVSAVLLGTSTAANALAWSKRIIRFIPLANPFSWLRDRSRARKGLNT